LTWQNGAIRVATVNDIAIEVHVTFGLVILWGGWQGWTQHHSLVGMLYGILIVLLLFACVLFHELGHAWQAKALGLVSRRVTLLPLGGLAVLETHPSHSWQELLIALVGPLVNLLLAAVAAGVALLMLPYSPVEWPSILLHSLTVAPQIDSLILYLLVVNLMLFLFNMLPAFPMDGGRVLRGALGMLIDYELATRLAAWLGRILAVLMAVLGAFGWPPANLSPNPLLVVVAVVVFFGARQEEFYVRRRRALVHREVQDVYRQAVDTLAPWDTISKKLIRQLFRQQGVMPVLVDGRVVGLLTDQDVQRRLHRSPSETTVAHLMRTDFATLRLRDTLWVAVREMSLAQLPTLPVVHDDRFHGVVHLEDIDHAWRTRKHARSRLHPGESMYK
jgi:Zn-dependent protease/predicted transcriptional regulator